MMKKTTFIHEARFNLKTFREKYAHSHMDRPSRISLKRTTGSMSQAATTACFQIQSHPYAHTGAHIESHIRERAYTLTHTNTNIYNHSIYTLDTFSCCCCRCCFFPIQSLDAHTDSSRAFFFFFLHRHTFSLSVSAILSISFFPITCIYVRVFIFLSLFAEASSFVKFVCARYFYIVFESIGFFPYIVIATKISVLKLSSDIN